MTGRLAAVELLGLPVPLYREASEHIDELRREFALIHRSGANEASVPARLQRLVDELEVRFAAFTSEPTAALRQAVSRGDDRVDLHYDLPAEAKEASIVLGALLDEADDYCRAGEHLLTLATLPRPLAFRQWFLGQFVAQLDGAEPTSWDQFASTRGDFP